MEPVVVAIVLFAALLHVTWNVLLKTTGEPMTVATIGIVAATLVAVPVAAAGWLMVGRPAVPLEAIALAVLSGLIETAYFVCLSAAYRHGDLSIVYPTARGTAPMIAVLIGVGLFGERLGTAGSVGVLLLLAGLLTLTRPWRLLTGELHPSDRTSTAYALAAGVLIATYSAVDLNGARLTEPWIYAALIWPAMAAGVLVWRWLPVARLVQRTVPSIAGPSPGLGPGAARAVEQTEPTLRLSRAIAGGLITLAAYLLILVAYAQAPLTAVAPLRESAVVVASGWGAFRLGEAEGGRDAARRVAAATLVAAGIALLVLEG